MANINDVPSLHERLAILKNEEAEQIKTRIILRLEALLAEKYVDQESLEAILNFLSE